MMIRHILLATDGSEQSSKAAAMSGELARALDAKVTILSALDDESVVAAAWGAEGGLVPTGGADASTELVREQMETTAAKVTLPEAAAAVGELKTPATVAHAWGRAAPTICDYAAEHDVDLIVIGSHGRTGIKAMVLGSVSQAVAKRAPCAITIVR